MTLGRGERPGRRRRRRGRGEGGPVAARAGGPRPAVPPPLITQILNCRPALKLATSLSGGCHPPKCWRWMAQHPQTAPDLLSLSFCFFSASITFGRTDFQAGKDFEISCTQTDTHHKLIIDICGKLGVWLMHIATGRHDLPIRDAWPIHYR